MRKKLIIAGATGALALSGLAVAVPALADDETPGASAPSTGAPWAEDRIRDALADLVTDGSLTQEQADEVASTLVDDVLGHRVHHGGGRLALSTAAEALGMSGDDLRAALRADDASLATVAEAQGVGVEDLVAALTTAAQERIAQAVDDGQLTQADADERLADLEERITERVNSTDLGMRGGHGPGGGHGD